MYREHFGLTLKPFSITPDPRFLYLSPAHKEALSHLLYGIKEGSGFVVITGEVGTGKTTILNTFLLRLPSRMPKVVIKNPHLKPENLYYLLGEAIGMPEEKRTRDYINEYEEKLKTTGGIVLIVDEAQGLSMEMLEEVRLLSNLETPHEKLVQIMLLGQQELNEKLNSPQLRQLKQRIGVKYHIPPLDSNETKDYIDHRLRIAGYEPKQEPIFTTSALGEIYRYSRGFPRLINIVCDNVLLACYTDEASQVSSNMVKKVAGDLEKTYSKVAPSSWSVQKDTYLRGHSSRFVFGILVPLILLAAVWVVLTHFNIPLFAGLSGMKQERTRIPLSENHISIPNGPAANVDPQGSDLSGQEKPKAVLQDQSDEANPPVPPSLTEPLKNNNSKVIVTIGEGDTVANLAARHYGLVNSDIVSAVRKANPTIPNIALVYKGQKVTLPVIQGSYAARTMYTVSVASYHSINEATAVFVDLVKKGFQATIYPYLDSQGNTWYRITIGTFTNQEKAKDHAQELKTKGFLYARPVKVSLEG